MENLTNMGKVGVLMMTMEQMEIATILLEVDSTSMFV